MEERKFDLSKVMKFAEKYKYIIVVMVVGLLFMSLPSENKDKSEENEDSLKFEISDFEKQIEKALASCDGVGRTKVILSVKSSAERIYAKEARQSVKEQESVTESDSDTKPTIMSEGSGKETPVIVKELYPEFRGAMVVCDGADIISVKTNVIESVSSLTGLSTDRISVIKMKN